MKTTITAVPETDAVAVRLHFEPESDDRTEIPGEAMIGRTASARLPGGFDLDATHPDVLALAALLSCRPWAGRRLLLDRPVSEPFAAAVAEHLDLELEPADPDLPPRVRPAGPRPGVAYSGGVDSVAAVALLPGEPHLYYLDRVIREDGKGAINKAAAHASCDDIERKGHLVRRVPCDVEYLRRPTGVPVNLPTDLSFALPAVLCADFDGLDALVTGILASSVYGLSGGRFSAPGPDHAFRVWQPVTAAAGLPFQPVAAGLTEASTPVVVDQAWRGEVLAQSCHVGGAGIPCGSCRNCFRKTLVDSALSGRWPEPERVDAMLRSPQALADLTAVPMPLECSLVFSMGRYDGRDLLLRLLRDRVCREDRRADWMARHYTPALDLLDDRYRDGVAQRIAVYVKAMTDEDIVAVESWDVKAEAAFRRTWSESAAFIERLTRHGSVVGKRRGVRPDFRPYRPGVAGRHDGEALPRNDWSSLRPAEIGRLEPRLTVSVVVPAYGGQEKLDLVLAGLAEQSYPAELTEVVVVDDRSDPPLRLPERRPASTRIVRTTGEAWGAGNAVAVGASASSGEVIVRLDADTVPFRAHIESHLRWHHLVDNLMVLGHKRFVEYETGTLSPDQVAREVAAGRADGLFDVDAALEAKNVKFLAGSDRLRTAHWSRLHSVMEGITVSTHRSLFVAAGGMDVEMVRGQDVEFAYRVGLAGGVFVPDDGESVWHLGIPEGWRNRDRGKRVRKALNGQRIPESIHRKDNGGRSWTVPLVDVVVDVEDASFEEVVDSVMPLLDGFCRDIRVTLVGSWPEPTTGREATLDHPRLDLKLVHEALRADRRVRFTNWEYGRADPSVPWRLVLSPRIPTTPYTIGSLLEVANRGQSGLVVARHGEDRMRLERRSIFARAVWFGAKSFDLDRHVERLSSIVRMSAPSSVARPEEAPLPASRGEWRRREELLELVELDKSRADHLAWHVKFSPTWVLSRLKAKVKRMLRR
ncbi:DUF6395 domain-containing protein [Glycomyces xiaoerkulensis]|uniref:DUF6395 domain-containing protein n=1 Tax=Glycomyces xiaoerkulensis TaxID=2038139 RepID=UPI000C261344|nr:DUF6395 domain-containing protein [Glycomyces xiaoerkulensis]